MPIAAGDVVYEEGAAPCFGVGLAWSDDDLDSAIADQVAAVLFDEEGKAEIRDMLADIAETEFERENLRNVLSDDDADIDDWRVGEAIAIAYLTAHRDCRFPWPAERDIRKRRSSLPGADLVGLRTDGDGDRLAFGEVKTSSEDRHPPSVMRGPEGLEQQIKNLRDEQNIRYTLVKYLMIRAKGTDWAEACEGATKRYIRNPSDVQLFGFLVRDVEPHGNDLRAGVVGLGADCPDDTSIELLALYLPKGRIEGLPADIVAPRPGKP